MAQDVSITVAPMDLSNWREALDVRVADEQLHFVADHQPVALVILAKAYLRPGGLEWIPLALMDDETMVGIAVLALAPDDRVCSIYHFVIDEARQGQGLGRRALNAVIDHIGATFPGCDRIFVTVHDDNRSAIHLYRSTGFEPTGDIRDGEAVYVMGLSRTAKA